MKILAIIPARGGSKGIPRKNIKLLAGKPLIAYTIQTALRSKHLDRVVVSTDDKEIAEISKRYGAEVAIRPPELSGDKANKRDIVFDCLKGEDIVIVLQPTSPLRTTDDIDKAIELFTKNKCESVISVCESNPYWSFKIKKYLEPVLGFEYFEINRQDLPKAYITIGAIFISATKTLDDYNGFFTNKMLPYIMPLERSIDIDTEFDFWLVEQILKKEKPCFVIAEAGINHNGDIRLAKRLVDVAVSAGADAVKFQTFKTEELLNENIEVIKKLELSNKDHYELSDYCKQKGIIFMSTPLDNGSVDLLDKIGVPMFKVASCDLDNLPLLKYIAKKGKPIILSTGMGTITEVGEAIDTIKSAGNDNITLLHCVSVYPPKEVDLRAIQTLSDAFKLPVGYSDHTIGISVPLAAVALGAKVIEKHFTLDKKMKGFDHAVSADPEELKTLIAGIREIEKSLGTGIKKPTKEEVEKKKSFRRSITANTDIKKGETITEKMLSIKRPGTGLSPKYYEDIISSRWK